MYDDELAISGLLIKELVSSATVACENSRDYVNLRSYIPSLVQLCMGGRGKYAR